MGAHHHHGGHSTDEHAEHDHQQHEGHAAAEAHPRTHEEHDRDTADGCCHGPAAGHDHGDHHQMMVADFQRRFWVSLALTLPVVALSPALRWVSDERSKDSDRSVSN